MYKALHLEDRDIWYVYWISPSESRLVAGPFNSRQAAHQKAKRLTIKAAKASTSA